MAKPRQRAKGTWSHEFEFRGKRYYDTFTSKARALEWERQVKSKIERGELSYVEKSTATVRDALDRYFRQNAGTLANSTFSLYETFRDKHVLRELGDRPLAALKPADITEWLSEKRAGGTAASTVKRLYEFLRAVLYVARDAGLVETAPLPSAKAIAPVLKGPKIREVRMLTDEEIVSVMRACKTERARTMVTLALNTGLRIGEMMAMQWEWIDWKRRVLRIPASLEADFVPKGKTEREITLLPVLEHALVRFMGQGEGAGLLFSGINWRRWARGLRKRARKLLGQMRRPDLGKEAPEVAMPFAWHLLRHTWISRMVMSGMSLLIVQRMAGHAKLETTMRYAHLAPDTHDVVRRMMGPGINPAAPKRPPQTQ